ncbi:MAG: hypothetical protein AAB371_00300 [Patescibacteria group bacterium]
MKIILEKPGDWILRFDLNEEYPNKEFMNFLKEWKIFGGYFFGLGNA